MTRAWSDRDLEVLKIEAMRAITRARDGGLEIVMVRLDIGKAREMSATMFEDVAGPWPADAVLEDRSDSDGSHSDA